MQISQSHAALMATAAFSVLLAGCSGGGSRLAPALAPAGGDGGGATQSVATQHLPAMGLRGGLGNLIPYLTDNRFLGTVAPGGPYLYASDNTTGDVDIFPEDSPNPIAVCAGCGGWGLAVRPGANSRLAIGTNGGKVGIYTPTGNPLYKETLTLSAGGAPLGLCFDFTGGLWATNSTGPKLDYFNAVLVNGTAGGPPTTTITAHNDIQYLFYIACDAESSSENTLYAYGITGGGYVVVDLVSPLGLETRETLVGGQAQHYPAGLAISATDDLVVNDQNHTLWNMGNREPWLGTVSNGCTWGPNPSNIWSIAWDNQDREVWAGDDYSTSPAGQFEESFAAPIPRRGLCHRGESGGPTNPLAGQTFGYYGTAAYPNLGN